MPSNSRAKKKKEAAIASGDPNRIMWVCYRAVACALFHHSLNAVAAIAMTEKELLGLKGIGPKAIKVIRELALIPTGDFSYSGGYIVEFSEEAHIKKVCSMAGFTIEGWEVSADGRIEKRGNQFTFYSEDSFSGSCRLIKIIFTKSGETLWINPDYDNMH